MRSVALALAAALAGLPPPAPAVTVDVLPGQSIQAAIDAAADGDVLRVAAGEFVGDLDYRGRAIAITGAGPATILRGTGTGPVVTFAGGEGPGSVLDSVTVTGGLAERGGGLYVDGASPLVLRTVITGNAARVQGSGVFLRDSAIQLHNNLIAFNHTALADPHSVEVEGGAPILVNNTIVRGDSNGIILRGAADALIMNNIIALNGSRVVGIGRGRGICDFSQGSPRIRYNVFWGNRRAALLTNGVDYHRIRRAERVILPPRLEGNVDGAPRFTDHRAGDFTLAGIGRAVDAGDPDPAFDDRDGTRNDAGHLGGPLAP